MKILFFFLFYALLPRTSSSQAKADLLIKNGKIIDGTGNSWFYGDISVGGGKILAIGKSLPVDAKRTIDATGFVITPGFIDVHTHIEGEESATPTADNFIHDGVTTVVTGNCGASNVDMKAYFKFLDSLRLSINVASLVGHNDVRKAVMSRANR